MYVCIYLYTHDEDSLIKGPSCTYGPWVCSFVFNIFGHVQKDIHVFPLFCPTLKSQGV